jgi:hypothetical protein
MVAVEQITREMANEILRAGDMQIGTWHRLEPVTGSSGEIDNWVQLEPPSDARELMRLAYNAVDWLADAEGYLVVFDGSTSLADFELMTIQLMCGSDVRKAVREAGAIKITSEPNVYEGKLLVSNIAFFSVIFSAHAYITSIGSKEGKILGILDEFFYFIGSRSFSESQRNWITSMRKNGGLPAWVSRFTI